MGYVSFSNWIYEILRVSIILQTLKSWLPSNFVVTSEWNSKPKISEISNLFHLSINKEILSFKIQEFR